MRRRLRRNDLPHVPFLWTRGIVARETLFYLDRYGIDAEPLLPEAELSRDLLTKDAAGVSVTSQHRFLELAANETDDPLLGLHVAAEIDLRDIGLLFIWQPRRERSRKRSNTWRGMPGPATKKSGSR